MPSHESQIVEILKVLSTQHAVSVAHLRSMFGEKAIHDLKHLEQLRAVAVGWYGGNGRYPGMWKAQLRRDWRS